MSSLFNVFNVAGSGMSAQSVRLNTVASNIANANSVSSSDNEVYRAKKPIFAAILSDSKDSQSVAVVDVVESDAPLIKQYMPNHPHANKDGYIYKPNVNTIEEMADMISASRSYQTNVQVADVAKQMLQETLKIGV